MTRIGRWVLSLILVALPLLWTVPTSSAQQIGNLSCTFQTATSSTGTGTVCAVGGYNILAVQTGGTVGTVVYQGTVDGTNYVTLLCVGSQSLSYIGSVTSAGVSWCSIRGFAFARANITVAGTNTTVSGIVLNGGVATFF